MKQVGRYRILSELGRGAMGIVYRAHDPRIARDIALKTIRLADHADSSEIDEVRGRLIREAQSAGGLSHAGIVTIFDVGEQDGLAYVAMELAEGRNLAEYLKDQVKPDRKLAFVADLLNMAGSALDYASGNGVIHRDVKPANIMVSHGEIKLLDFGVARITSSQLTQAGTVVGTPNYMSPEQVRGDPVDGRSDQFSLAVIAYEILTGTKPFGSRNIATTLYNIAHVEPDPMRRRLPGMPTELDRVVLRGLAKDPNDRFECCSAFADAFADAARGQAGLWGAVAVDLGSEEWRQDVTVDGIQSPELSDADLTTDHYSDPLPRIAPRTDHAAESDPMPAFPPQDRLTEPAPAGAAPALPLEQPADSEHFDHVEPRRARWPSLIFALLVCAIGALTMLLVRYPGLLEDRRLLVETIFGIGETIGTVVEGVTAPDEIARTAAPAQAPADPTGNSAAGSGVVPEGDTESQQQSEVEPTGDDASGGALAGDSSPDTVPIEADTSAVPTTDEGASPPAQKPVAPQLAAVFFESNVQGVLVTVDGNRDWRCMTPCEIGALPVGEHDVVAYLSGYALQRRSITVSGQGATVDLQLERQNSTLVITSDPFGARIIVDGQDTGKLTNAQLDVAPGRHSVRLQKEDLSAEQSIEIDPGEFRHLTFRLGSK